MSRGGTAAAPAIALHDEAPDVDEFRADVLRGLDAPRKTLPCKYLYDNRGAELFERICGLEAYYPTRVERSILQDHGREIGRALGRNCRIVELGSGSAVKTELLLGYLDQPAAYVPIDISRAQLVATAERLARRFPGLEVLPVCADYSRTVTLPRGSVSARRTVVFFPGSTIGNLEPPDATRFLKRISQLVGPGGAALIGADRRKDPTRLEHAYDDPEGVTAEFNRNLLIRINRELGANFHPERFAHRAVYDAKAGRIEMHLVSLCDQIVQVPRGAAGPAAFAFRQGESIVTEHSYKYTIEGFSGLAREARLRTERVWSDPDDAFSIFLVSGPRDSKDQDASAEKTGAGSFSGA